MPADTTGFLPPFLPTAFPLNFCVSKGCETLCLHHPCCPILCGHFSPLARLELGTCRECKGAEALMQLSGRDCGVECFSPKSKAGFFSLWLISLACFLLETSRGRCTVQDSSTGWAFLSGCALTPATPRRDQSPHWCAGPLPVLTGR